MRHDASDHAWWTLGADYWRFFAAAFVFDLATGLFLFLLNLFLTERGFNEQSIGKFMAALTVGNLIGTLPAALVARRFGIKRLLLLGFLCSPLAAAARIVASNGFGQLAFAFLQGACLCAWPICFAPTIAKLTTERNRTAGFSIVFATGIGLGAVAGTAGGWIPRELQAHGLAHSASAAMRWVLMGACATGLAGAWPLARLNMDERLSAPARCNWRLPPFLLRFLSPFLLWNVATASFPVFGAIWLRKAMGLGLDQVGFVFSGTQLAQCAGVLACPLLMRRAGLSRGVAVAQFTAALFAVLLVAGGAARIAIALYVLYSAAQFLCGPSIYNLLMDRIPESERSTASAVQNACGAICQAGSSALTGYAIVHGGYGVVLKASAWVALSAGVLFLGLGRNAKTTDGTSDTEVAEAGGVRA